MTTEIDYQEAAKLLSDMLSKLGATIVCAPLLSDPRGPHNPWKEHKDARHYQCVATIGKESIGTPWSVGAAVPLEWAKKQGKFRAMEIARFEREDGPKWNQKVRYKGFLDEVAKAYRPEPVTLFSSLLLDSIVPGDGVMFEDWCSDYGLDTDSRSAFATFETCCTIGRKLAKMFGPEFERARDLARAM